MKTIVQKYGGTSVNSREHREHIIRNARKVMEQGMVPIVVVSAMGRYPEPYATDSLLSLLPKKEPKPQNKDLLLCCGEVISASVVAEELCEQGLDSVALTGGQAGILTDDNFGDAKIISINTELIESYIQKKTIPVVTGFQGANKYGCMLTLGRGGSDTSATALGSALKSERVEIYTDVDGVMTTDPRIVSDAKLLKQINYFDILNMANKGAKVVHPRAIEHAMRANVPVHVLNVEDENHSVSTIINDKNSIVQGASLFGAIASCIKDFNVCEITLMGEVVSKNENIKNDITNLFNSEGIEFKTILVDQFSAMIIIDELNANKAINVLHSEFIK